MLEKRFGGSRQIDLLHYIEKDGSLVAGNTPEGPNYREDVVFNNGLSYLQHNHGLIWVEHLKIDNRSAIRPHDPRQLGALKDYYKTIGIVPDVSPPTEAN